MGKKKLFEAADSSYQTIFGDLRGESVIKEKVGINDANEKTLVNTGHTENKIQKSNGLASEIEISAENVRRRRKRELKSKHFNLMLRPSTYDGLNDLACLDDTSVSDILTKLAETLLRDRAEDLKRFRES